nr:MAG TPA: hypothetical protein [Caudoviricetes sp.]
MEIRINADIRTRTETPFSATDCLANSFLTS